MFDFKTNVWPTVEEERARTWRRMPLLVQIVFFVLTIVAVAALYGFVHLMKLPQGWVTAAICIVTAEVLIRRARFWRTGMESALWIGGLFAFIVALPSSGRPEAILVFAAAAAIAGWRVRNGLFGALAMVLVTAYFGAREWPWMALAFAVTVSLAALAALAKSWQRPSTEFLWQVTFLVMPVAGYVACVAARFRHRTPALGVTALFSALAVVFAVTGVRLRIRLPLAAAAIAAAIAVIEARDLIPFSPEVELIVAGAIVFAVAAGIMRALRGRTSGFVAGTRKSEAREVLQIAAMIPLATPAAPPAKHGPGGGGEFGGAGSSGQF